MHIFVPMVRNVIVTIKVLLYEPHSECHFKAKPTSFLLALQSSPEWKLLSCSEVTKYCTTTVFHVVIPKDGHVLLQTSVHTDFQFLLQWTHTSLKTWKPNHTRFYSRIKSAPLPFMYTSRTRRPITLSYSSNPSQYGMQFPFISLSTI